MRTGIFILICLGFTLLAGCDKEPEVGADVSRFEPYQQSADMPALKARGIVR